MCFLKFLLWFMNLEIIFFSNFMNHNKNSTRFINWDTFILLRLQSHKWSAFDFLISSLKNQVERSWFRVDFELEFYCLCSLQNSSSKQTKNQVRPTWLFKLDYLKNILQIDRGIDIFLEILLIWFEWVER